MEGKLLLACPFCGSKRTTLDVGHGVENIEFVRVTCIDCMASSAHERDSEAAIEKWNMRDDTNPNLELELDNLRQWKKEALESLMKWDRICDHLMADPSAPLGKNMAEITLNRLKAYDEIVHGFARAVQHMAPATNQHHPLNQASDDKEAKH